MERLRRREVALCDRFSQHALVGVDAIRPLDKEVALTLRVGPRVRPRLCCGAPLSSSHAHP
eukprot:7049348-Prymnesium_polylepis.1